MYNGPLENFCEKIKVVADPNDLYHIRNPDVNCVMLRRKRNLRIDDFVDSLSLFSVNPGERLFEGEYEPTLDKFSLNFHEIFRDNQDEKGKEELLNDFLFANKVFVEATRVFPQWYGLDKVNFPMIRPHTDGENPTRFSEIISYGSDVKEGTLFFHPSSYETENWIHTGGRLEVLNIENRISSGPHWITIFDGYAVHSAPIGTRIRYSITAY